MRISFLTGPVRLLTIVLGCLSLAPAKIHRIGLFLGMDRGLASEPPLKFASRDARQMGEVFRQSGLYSPHEMFEVSNAPLDRVRAAMGEVEAAAKAPREAGDQTYLFVYFSGHGDSQSLHVQNGKLDREDLIAWMNGIPVDLKILVLDACESGNFLRSKGARLLEDAAQVRIDKESMNRGSIIISSTSRGELAQESDEYQGAVFTHHLVNGLRGLANYNGDGWIGLEEAFEYSRRATHMDMALGGDLKQNPSFDLDLVGGSDPGLIPVLRGRSHLMLRNFPSGNLEIMDSHSLTSISKVWLSGADSLDFNLPAGSYLFRIREGVQEFLHSASLAKNGSLVIERQAFRPKVKWNWTAKGGSQVRLAGFQPSFGFTHPYPGIPMRMGRMDYLIRTASAKRDIGLGIATGSASDSAARQSADLTQYRASVSQVHFLAGSRRLRLYSGGLAAFSLVREELTDLRFNGLPVQSAGGPVPANTTHWSNLYQLGMPFELEWAVWGRLWLSGEAVYSLYGYEDTGRGRFRVRLELEPFLGLGMHF